MAIQEVKLTVNIIRFHDPEGTVHEIRKPTMDKKLVFAREIEESRDSKDPEALANCMKRFLVGCGLSKKFVNDLDEDNLITVCEALGPKKKP